MPSPGRSCMPLFLQLRPVPLPWPGHMCLLFPLPSTGYGPLTVNTNSLDSIRPSSVQIAPCSSQSSVTGRMIVTAPSVLCLTVIRQRMLLGLSSRCAFFTVPPLTVKAWSRRVR